MEQNIEAWHFLPDSRRLNHYPHTQVIVGQALTVSGPLVLCEYGLHWSMRAIDALRYAPGPIICRVRAGGRMLHDTDKGCSSKRTVLWMADANETISAFARWCALSVGHLWNMPDDVRQYLETGAPELRTDAWITGYHGVRDNNGGSATAASTAAYCMISRSDWNTAYDVARSAAWALRNTAAYGTDYDAIFAAAMQTQNDELERRILTLAPTPESEA